jgi:hypothetical protein
MNVMNRSMFVNRDARSKLAGMGGIMSSSPELMSAGRQGFADGGQTSFLERVNEVGVEKAPTYIISSPELTGGNFLEISAETLSALNSVVPNLVTPDGESIFVADAASVSPLSREQARPGDAIVGTRLKQVMAQMPSTPQAAPAPALDDVFDQRIRQGLEPDGRASLDEELFDSAVYRADDTAGQGQALAEAYARGNSPKQLMQEASSVTPMDMSNGDPDFSGIMKLQQAEEKQQQDFTAAAEAASNSRALLRERGMSASQRQRAAEAEGQDVVHEAFIQPTSLGLNLPGTATTLADGSPLSTAGMFSGVSDGDSGYYGQFPLLPKGKKTTYVQEQDQERDYQRMLEAGLNPQGRRIGEEAEAYREGLIPAEGSGRDTAANRMIAGELMAQRADVEEQDYQRMLEGLTPNNRDGQPGGTTPFNTKKMNMINVQRKNEEQAAQAAQRAELLTRNVDPNEESALDMIATENLETDEDMQDRVKVAGYARAGKNAAEIADIMGLGIIKVLDIAAGTLAAGLLETTALGADVMSAFQAKIMGNTDSGRFYSTVANKVKQFSDNTFYGDDSFFPSLAEGVGFNEVEAPDSRFDLVKSPSMVNTGTDSTAALSRLDELSGDDPVFSDNDYNESVPWKGLLHRGGLRASTIPTLDERIVELEANPVVVPEANPVVVPEVDPVVVPEVDPVVVPEATTSGAVAIAERLAPEWLRERQLSAENKKDAAETKQVFSGSEGLLTPAVAPAAVATDAVVPDANTGVVPEANTGVVPPAWGEAGGEDSNAGRGRSSLRTPEPAGRPIYSPADVKEIVYKDPKDGTALASKLLEQADLPQGDTETNLASYKKLIQEIMGGGPSEKQRNQEKWNNFAMIGFAIAAGQSPNAMTNIAQGMLEGTKLMSSQRTARAAREDKMNMFALEQTSLDNRARIRASGSGSSYNAQDRLYNSTFKDILSFQLNSEGATVEEAVRIASEAASEVAPNSSQSTGPVTELSKLTKGILRAKELKLTLKQIYKKLDENKIEYDPKFVSDIYKGNK